MLHRWAQLAQAAIGIADVILNIGVARLAQRREFERRDRSIPILGDQCLLACCEIRVEPRPVGLLDSDCDQLALRRPQSTFRAGGRMSEAGIHFR